MSAAAKDNFNSRVLIVEDELQARTVIKKNLLALFPSLQLVDAGTAAEALDLLNKQKFDVVFTDYRITNADSGAFLNEIRKVQKANQPAGVVVASSLFSDSDLGKLGNVLYIPKPYTEGHLQESFSMLLDPDYKKNKASERTHAAGTSTIDINFINPFVAGAIHVMELTCGVKVIKDKVFIRDTDKLRGDVSAVCALNSANTQGSFAITFDKKTFLMVAGGMLGDTYTDINEENIDVVGEICNQVFGHAKRELNKTGYELQPSLPSVITGDAHEIRHLVSGAVIVAYFKLGEGWFALETAVTSTSP